MEQNGAVDVVEEARKAFLERIMDNMPVLFNIAVVLAVVGFMTASVGIWAAIMYIWQHFHVSIVWG